MRQSHIIKAAIKDLRKLLLQNGYPQGVIMFNINDVLNKNKNKSNNPVQATVPKKDILIVLPYLGLHSAKSDHSSAIADHVKTTGHDIKWDHFDILASGKTDFHCKIKETLFIQGLRPSLNVNVSSEKLLLF